MKRTESYTRLAGDIALYILSAQALAKLSGDSANPLNPIGDIYMSIRELGGGLLGNHWLGGSLASIFTLGLVTSFVNEKAMDMVFNKARRNKLRKELDSSARQMSEALNGSENKKGSTAQDFNWFKNLSREQQLAYLQTHPRSKLNKDKALLQKLIKT